MSYDWKAERKRENRDKIFLKYKVRAVAKSIGWIFPYQKPDGRYKIFDKHGNEIFFYTGYRNEGKTQICANSVYSKYSISAIGVSINRPISAFRNEIKRRIMPRLKEQYKKDKAIYLKDKENFNKNIQLALNLSHAQGTKIDRKSYSYYSNERTISLPFYNGHAEICQGEKYVNISMKLTEEKSIEVLKLLKRRKK